MQTTYKGERMKIKGTYADDEDRTLNYVCRVFQIPDGTFRNGIDEPIEIKHGDVLKVCGQGTWFALYQ